MAGHLTYRYGRCQLSLRFADITASEAQVIVSSDDAYLSMGGGVSEALARAGGEAIALDAAKHIPAALGSVVVTTAGQLSARYVFHVITRSPNENALPEQILRSATQRCMQLVEALQIDSIAFPVLGGGYAQFPLDQVAAEMAKVIAAALTNSVRPVDVTIYLHDDKHQMREIDFIPFIARFAARVPEFADHKATDADPQPVGHGVRDRIFVSYSHKNKEWLDKLLTMLTPLVRNKSLDVWDDRQITPGANWRKEIERALSATRVAVLIVSPEFLASEFIAEKELVPLLRAAEKEGVTVLWLCVSACLYDETGIEGYQAAHDISRPLDSLTPAECNAALVAICREIKKASARA